MGGEHRDAGAMLRQHQGCPGAAAGLGETSSCGRELGGRVLVSWESVEGEKLGLQDANPQEKQDLVGCCLQKPF